MTCFFENKAEDDVKRYVKEIVYMVLDTRLLTQKDEEAIRITVDNTISLAMKSHEIDCDKDKRGTNRVNLANIVSVIAVIVAILALAKEYLK